MYNGYSPNQMNMNRNNQHNFNNAFASQGTLIPKQQYNNPNNLEHNNVDDNTTYEILRTFYENIPLFNLDCQRTSDGKLLLRRKKIRTEFRCPNFCYSQSQHIRLGRFICHSKRKTGGKKFSQCFYPNDGLYHFNQS